MKIPSASNDHDTTSRVRRSIFAMPFVGEQGANVEAFLRLGGGLHHELVDDVILRLAALAWDLPASESDHHCGAWGLLYHSLEVANFAARRIELSEAAIPAKETVWRYAAYLWGLGHDIGKVMDVEVTAANGDKWNPFSEPLACFCARHTSNVQLRHRAGRTSQDHIALWPYLFSTLLTSAVARFLQPILLELLLNESPNARAVWSAVRRADFDSARGLSRSPP